jgi:hypothetical protein
LNSFASKEFWELLAALDGDVQALASKNFALFREDSRHPSLHFKRVGSYWSARVGRDHRVLAREDGQDLVWFWIGPHDEYQRLIRQG